MSTTRLLEDSLNCLIPPDAAASRSGCYGKTDKKKKKALNYIACLPIVEAQKSRKNDQINKIRASHQYQAGKTLCFWWGLKPCRGRNKNRDTAVPDGIKQ